MSSRRRGLLSERAAVVGLLPAVIAAGVTAWYLRRPSSRPAQTERRPTQGSSSIAAPRAVVSGADANAPAVAELHVPRAPDAITFTGKIEDEAWKGSAARTGGFVNGERAIARPYSEARFTWGQGNLYMILYAADEDIVAPERRSDEPLTHDKFTLTFPARGEDRVIEVTPRGVMTDGTRPAGSDPTAPLDLRWSSGAHVLADAEEEIDNSHDEDEEWIVEATLPLASLGYRGEAGEQIPLRLERCDVPKGGVKSCGSWGVAPPINLVLDGDETR